jgi:hypothetical protein
LGCLAMPSYVARPHVLANKFVPGYLGDSFGLLLCVPKIRFCNIGDEDRQGQVAM